MAAPIVPNRITHFFNGLYSQPERVGISTSHLAMWRKGGDDQTNLILDALQFSYDIILSDGVVANIDPRSQIEHEKNIGGNLKTKIEQKYQNVGNLFPIIKKQAGVSHDQTFQALAGELGTTMSPGTDMSKIEKAKELITLGVKDNLKEIGRRFNLSASEVIRTGKMTLSEGSQYNFDRATSNTQNIAITWDNPTTAIPKANLARLYEAVRDNGDCTPGFVGMGQEALTAFFATDEITTLANSRRLNFISGGRELPALPPGYQRMVDAGWVYMAYLLTDEGYPLYIFANNDNYRLVKQGTRFNFQPKKDVLMMDPTIRCDLYLGPKVRFDMVMPGQRQIETLFGISSLKSTPIRQEGSNIIEPWMLNHDTWMNESRTFIGVETYTSPVPVPTQVNGAGALPDVVP